jgi:hypothetical protein
MVALALLALLVALGVRNAHKPEPGMSGDAPTPHGTPAERLERLATHEAGHAVVAWHCPIVDRVSGLIIESAEDGPALWHGQVLHGWRRARPDERLAWDVVIALAGFSAEVLRYGRVRSLSRRDLDEALLAARSFCRRGKPWPFDGFDPPVPFPFEVACSNEERDVLVRAWSLACVMLMGHRVAHERIASAAAIRRRLSEQELATILGPRAS